LKPKAYITDEVIVSAQKAEKEIPLPKTNIPKKKLEKLNVGQDMPFVLRTMPSVVVTTNAGNGVGYTGIRIRGIDSRGINVTINGIPLNDAESQGVWWVDLPDLAANTENIQIQRGLGTSTNGTGAFGATINLQTTATSKKPYAQANFSGGSFNTFRENIKAGTGLIDSSFAFDLSMSKLNSDGFVDRAFSDLKSLSFTGSYYGKKSLLKFVLLTGKEKTYQSWYGVPVEVPDASDINPIDSIKDFRENPYKYDNQTDNYQQDHYQLHYAINFTDELSFKVSAYYVYGRGYYENYKEGASLSSYFGRPVVVPNTTDTIYSSDIVNQKWLDNDLYGLTYYLKYNNNYINIMVGGGASMYDGRHFGKLIWAQWFGENNMKTDSLIQKDYEWYRGYGDKGDYNEFAKINWFATEKLNFYADMQVREIKYSLNGKTDANLQYKDNINYTFFNPRLGLSYDISSGINAYAYAGIGHREPMRSDFIDHLNFSKKLVPEKLLDIEAGLNYSNKRMKANINLYDMQYHDQLVNTGKLNDVGAPIRINVPESYRRGIEIDMSAKVMKKLEWAVSATLSQNKITKGFSLFYDHYDTNWNWVDQVADTFSTGVIPYSPNAILGTYFLYTPFKGLEVSVYAKYVSSQSLDLSGYKQRSIPAYHTETFRIAYSKHFDKVKEWTIFFTLNNFLSSKPFATDGWIYTYVFGNEKYNDFGFYPEAPMFFMAGTSIKF